MHMPILQYISPFEYACAHMRAYEAYVLGVCRSIYIHLSRCALAP